VAIRCLELFLDRLLSHSFSSFCKNLIFVSGIATDRQSVYCFCVVLTNMFGYSRKYIGFEINMGILYVRFALC